MKTLRQSGFTLVASIFLLVVVAALAVYMSNIRVAQQTTLVYGLQGARAMQAARSGIEWGISRAINLGSCVPAASFPLDGFNVRIECQSSSHIEGTFAPVIVYRLDVIASTGAYGSLDYVQRQIRATVSQNPP